MSKFFQRRDLDKTFFKVLVSMLMVFVLLISVASPSHAVVGVTSILIPSVIAALESWGISTAADGLDGAAIAEWFHDKLTDWSTYAGIALENIVTGIKMTPIGQVLLNPIALAGIREFGAWLVQEEGLVAGGSSVTVVSSAAEFWGYPMYSAITCTNGNDLTFQYVADPGVYLFVKLNSRQAVGYYSTVYGVSESSTAGFTVRVTYTSTGNLESTSRIDVNREKGNNGLYYGTSSFANWRSSTAPSADFTVDQVAASSDNTIETHGSLTLDPSADMAVPSASDIQNKEMLINTSLDVGADAAAWYEQVMNKVAANDMTATSTLVGSGTITADKVIDQGAITEQEGVVSWPDVTVPIGVSGLDEIFPFCIPFDIYHFFEALAADPVAPSFEIPFVIEGVVDYTFEIDLEPFDQAAQILRLVELLAFCVGLAFVTRSMFIRG